VRWNGQHVRSPSRRCIYPRALATRCPDPAAAVAMRACCRGREPLDIRRMPTMVYAIESKLLGGTRFEHVHTDSVPGFHGNATAVGS
jgi:hypothetical protein